MKPRIVILCAGASSRLGEPKALATIGGRVVLEWMLTASHSALEQHALPLVVTGAHHGAITKFLALVANRIPAPLASEALFNPHWSLGRTGGVQLAGPRCPDEDLLIWPADVPLVSATSIEALLREWSKIGSPPRGWLAPRVERRDGEARSALDGARFGHPILLGHELVREAQRMDPGTPLRQLREQASPLCSLGVEDLAVLDDLDTPDDLERLRQRVGRG